MTLVVFNALGQAVATPVNGYEEAGSHDVRFDGSGLPSGVYFCAMNTGDYSATRRLLLLK